MAKAISLITLIFGLLSHSFSIAAAPKIVLAHGALNARIAPLWIAHEQKFFTKYGVDSTVILVRQIQIMVSGLGTGEIDIALTSGSTLLGAAAGGLDAKMVAALNANSPDASSTNSIRSPAERPSFCRTAIGTVIRPLLVSLVAVIALLRRHPDRAI